MAQFIPASTLAVDPLPEFVEHLPRKDLRFIGDAVARNVSRWFFWTASCTDTVRPMTIQVLHRFADEGLRSDRSAH